MLFTQMHEIWFILVFAIVPVCLFHTKLGDLSHSRFLPKWSHRRPTIN